MKKKTKSTPKSRLHRMFTIAKVFLAITPVIAYFYVTMIASSLGITFQEVLAQQPSITIIFLIAMVNPYVAYLLHIVEKKLEANEGSYALINMLFLLVAQLLTMNVFYFMMLLLVFYKAVSYHQLDVKSILKSINMKQTLWNGGGSFLVIMISSICLFATIRLL